MNIPEHPPSKKGGGYPREFREEAVRYWLNSGKKAGEVAPELGVSDWSLNRWRKEMEHSDGSGKAGRVKWNFEKFVVSPTGDVHRFRPTTQPDAPEVIAAIEAGLPA